MSAPVLIVDDNRSKRTALRAVLDPLGYSIVEADCGIEALRCVMAQDFAVILLDVRMPVMDGFETASLIRLRSQSEMTPIIFITAHDADEMVDSDRFAEGAVDFMFAPVQPEELRAKVSVFANLFIKAAVLAERASEVQRSADQLRLLTDAAPVGIFQTDAENRYEYTNPRWSEITGISAEDAAGRPWDCIIDVDQRNRFRSEQPAPTGADLLQRFEIEAPGAGRRIVLLRANAIPDDEGGTAGWVGILADVTAEAGAEAAMASARDQATAASQMKSDFLANMSHEIRTPMNGVLGMTDLLLETDLDDRQRDYAQTVRSSGEALLTIIDDILDFSKVEAGKLEVEEIAFDPRAVVEGVVDLLAATAEAKGLELLAFVPSDIPETVTGDPGRVRQVLTNLVGNAIKFTRAGEVVVRVSEVAQGKDVTAGVGESVLRFDVTDTGHGIPEDKLALIFKPFAQADSSTSRRHGGTGLGLAISSQLVALMGGDCGVTSVVDAGSTFWFTVRVGNRRAREASLWADLLAGTRVLVVDDSASVRELLAEGLTSRGMTVATAASGRAGLTALRKAAAKGQPFSLALVDRTMPGMDGVKLRKAIEADPALDIRVVLLTGVAPEPGLTDVEESPATRWLAKPFRHSDLETVLRAALLLPDPTPAPAAAPLPSPTALPVAEGTTLLLAEDNLINQKVAVAMLSQAGYAVDTAVNGAEAVDAFKARDYDAVLMDCQMPELNGYEATAAMRAHENGGRRTPIIAMTAGARGEDRKRCLAAGMDDYLAKPVSKEALLSMVARSIRGLVPAVAS